MNKWFYVLIVTGILSQPFLGRAGELEPSSPPGPTMRTLDEIYQKLETASSEAPEIPSESLFTVSTGMNASFLGATQGQIAGSCMIDGRTNSIIVTGFDHEVNIPIDQHTGLPTGQRVHGPLTIVKYRDIATPKLFAALTKGEALNVVITFYHKDAADQEVPYFTITLVEALLIKGEALTHLHEAWSMTYSQITWRHVPGAVEYEDSGAGASP